MMWVVGHAGQAHGEGVHASHQEHSTAHHTQHQHAPQHHALGGEAVGGAPVLRQFDSHSCTVVGGSQRTTAVKCAKQVERVLPEGGVFCHLVRDHCNQDKRTVHRHIEEHKQRPQHRVGGVGGRVVKLGPK